MRFKLLESYLPESQLQFYKRTDKRWEVKTTDCLQVDFEDGLVTTYIIYNGPWTLPNMCRDCGTYYELALGTNLYRIERQEVTS